MKDNFKDFQKTFGDELEKVRQKIKKPNILIIGGTGVGKSSLVNLCFGTELAKVGVGKPVTDKITRYETSNVPVVLFDTIGYEIGEKKQEKFFNHISTFTEEQQTKPIEEQIHLVWFCIQASNHRILDIDFKIITEIQKQKIPLAVVLTKCDLVTHSELNTLKKTIDYHSCFGVNIAEKQKTKYLELHELIKWSLSELPIGLKEAFVTAQRINLELKKEAAKKIISQHTKGNALIGFTPIPFADAPFLVSSQMGMFARILNIYDLAWLKQDIEEVIEKVLFTLIAAEGGKLLVANLIKIIPGAGQTIGGVISGAVAASITFALGSALSEICYQLYNLLIDGENEQIEIYLNSIDWKKLITQYLKTYNNEK